MIRKSVSRPRLAAVAAAAIAMSAATAGCSSSGGNSAVSASGAPAGRTVTVGFIGTVSGATASSFGGLPDVLDAWASSVNAAGGLGGEPVRIVVKDTGTGTEPGLADAKELIAQDHAVAIIDFDSAPDDATWLPYANKENVPVIVSGPYTSALTDPGVFPVISSIPATVYSLAALAKTYGPKFGFLYASEIASGAGAAALFKVIDPSLGISLSRTIGASSSVPDYTSVCAQMAGNVSSYYASFASAADERITDTCYRQGLRIPQLLTAGTAAPFRGTDAAFRGDPVVDYTVPYFATNTPAERAYRNALKKYAPSIIGTSLDNSSGMWVWAGGQLLAAASRGTSGPLTSQSVRNGLYSLKNETLGGLVQPLTFTRGQPARLYCNFVWKIGPDGRFLVEEDGKPSCAPPGVLNPLISAIVKPS